MTIADVFHSNITRALKAQNITKQELSRRSGVSVSFLSDLTNGKANPSLKVISMVADALGVSEVELLTSPRSGMIVETEGFPIGVVEIKSAVVPEQKAFIIKQWDAQTRANIERET